MQYNTDDDTQHRTYLRVEFAALELINTAEDLIGIRGVEILLDSLCNLKLELGES